ncbi:cyclase family protein [Kordiimonas sp. SCSIO 12610]|uniref:cyclase family protein n=1 Tax=Kordiimonas sp. SCSIO 12610 TaxID=2829597 RepID=UPI00210D6D38|nr:cyclase family protein [Kordiimonas sp. SCSIO 12610]UTW54348.1 cyclase family protein [Kordiimonas sp. SCSIO 12610]
MKAHTKISVAATLFAAMSFQSEAQVIDLGKSKIVDLSHTYDENTLYWPNSPSKFDHKTLAYGPTDAGYFYSAYTFATPEHGGTHLDAPIHFHKDGDTVEKISTEKLVLPAIVIDISEKANKNHDYRLQLSDIKTFEEKHGTIPSGAAILLRTKWDRFWPDAKSYLGDDTPGKTTDLHFPSFGAEATRFLVNDRGAAMIGIDTASIDYGPSQDFIVHQIVAEKNIPDLENLTGLDKLPETGATIIALPMKIAKGSGAPVRVIAVVPE